MGWFGTGALDGDDGMDLRDELFGFIGIKYDADSNILQTKEQITSLLNDKQDKIYDWLGDYAWSKHYNPSFIRQVYIQATAQIFVDYGVKINTRGKPVFLDFIKNDQWSKIDDSRKESMDKLYKEVKTN